MTPRPKARAQKRRDPGSMSLTEKRYAEVLEAMRLSGKIDRWDFEPETLKLAFNTRYEPDFRVIMNDGIVVFVEVKPNGYKFIPNQDKSTVKLKVAAELHPYIFWRAVERPKKSGRGFEIEVIEGR